MCGEGQLSLDKRDSDNDGQRVLGETGLYERDSISGMLWKFGSVKSGACEDGIASEGSGLCCCWWWCWSFGDSLEG